MISINTTKNISGAGVALGKGVTLVSSSGTWNGELCFKVARTAEQVGREFVCLRIDVLRIADTHRIRNENV